MSAIIPVQTVGKFYTSNNMEEQQIYGKTDPRGKFLGCAIGFVIAVLVILCCELLIGCSPKVIEKVVNHTDTTYIEKQIRDSVYLQDSIFVEKWRNGDTVFVTQEKWHTKWRERLVKDTAFIAKSDTVISVQVKEVPRKLTFLQKFQIWAGRAALALIAIALAIFFIRYKRT